MKIFFTIGILAIVATVLAILFFSNKQSAPVDTQNQVGLPIVPSTVGQTGTKTSSSSTTTTVAANDGTTVITNDFIHNGVTFADPSNAGNYYLTESSINGYSIGYRTPAQFFTIALEKEPLGDTRIAVESFLLSVLGVSESQLCSLKYYLGTDVQTNSLYAGKNLGFSFCPGATVLPK